MKPKNKYEYKVLVTYPADYYFDKEYDYKLRAIVGRYSDGSGMGMGVRDCNWYFKTLKGAKNTLNRIKKAKLKGVKVKLYKVNMDPFSDEDDQLLS
jgi:hypothetical protein